MHFVKRNTLGRFSSNGVDLNKYAVLSFSDCDMIGLCLYKNQFNRLYFSNLLMDLYHWDFDRMAFYWSQADKNEAKFYGMVLHFIMRKSQKSIEDFLRFEKVYTEILKYIPESIRLKVHGQEETKIDYNINGLASYLSGRYPSCYKAPFDKLELIEKIEEICHLDTEDLKKLTNSESFYLMTLNFVKRKTSPSILNSFIQNIIKQENISEDVYLD